MNEQKFIEQCGDIITNLLSSCNNKGHFNVEQAYTSFKRLYAHVQPYKDKLDVEKSKDYLRRISSFTTRTNAPMGTTIEGKVSIIAQKTIPTEELANLKAEDQAMIMWNTMHHDVPQAMLDNITRNVLREK